MIRGMKRRLSRWLMARRVARYGNNHSGAINRHDLAYHQAAKAVWRPAHPGEAADPESAEAARRLAEDGFLVVPPPAGFDGAALKARVDAAFADRTNTYDSYPGLLRLIDGAELCPDAIDLLKGPVERIVETLLGSHFKLFLATFYRTVPNEDVQESSFLWHFDNAPDLQLKAMIYLDDVTAETGAFRFKSKKVSEEARAAGFWHRDDYERGRAVFENEATSHVIEAPAGTVILFQPGRVVHKATAPRHGHRDVAVLVLNPSKLYWREHLARNRHLISTNGGLCLDLETDRPENIGYRY